MSNAIDQMKKTLDANKTHVENALKETAHAPVKKTPTKSTPKPTGKSSVKPSPPPGKKATTSKVHQIGAGQQKPAAKRFAEAYEKAVTPRAPVLKPLPDRTEKHEKEEKPEVTMRGEGNNHQIPPWETASTVVSVEAPNVPETVVDRRQIEVASPVTPTARNRRYEDSHTPDRSLKSPPGPVAVMGVLGSGFRPVSPTIKR